MLAMLRLLAFCLLAAGPVLAQSKTIYLTFDDGPQPGTTDVLDVLKEEGATAAFFLTGSNALSVGGIEGQAAIIRRMLAEGHEIASHCYIHKPMTKADYRATYGDLSTEAQLAAFRNNWGRNERHFQNAFGKPDFKFAFARLPGDGSTFPHLVAETERLGVRHFHWQNEFAPGGVFKWLKHADWHGASGVSADYAELPRDGAVLLFHDRHWAGENRALLRGLLRVFKAKGYTFGKLADWKPAPPASRAQ
jgi:peptidoglycan/xylan/chitin deacetylase (PgdA/CDA1 family)